MRRLLPTSFGPFTVAQARALGYSRGELRAALEAGVLVRLRRGVLVTAADRSAAAARPSTLCAQDVQALRLAMSRVRLVAAGASAAVIHGLDLRYPPGDELIVLTDDERVSGTHRDGYFLRAAYLSDDQVVERHGVPVTSVARTLIDIAAHRGFDDGVVATESAYRRRLITPAELKAEVDAVEGRPGILIAREALEFADPKTESVLESISRITMRELNIVMPETQVVLYDDDFLEIRVDFFWPHLRLVGEADGMAKYSMNGRDPMAELRRQRRREEVLRDQDLDIVRWDWRIANQAALLGPRLHSAFARAAQRLHGAG